MSHDQHTPDSHRDEHPELDARLTAMLRAGTTPPTGLTDRVFEVSRHHLPAPAPLAQLNAAADVELEARLTGILANPVAPAGLTDRVFAASVGSLPSPMRLTSPDSQRRIRHPRRVFGGRLAMAASVALVACVGIWFARMPGTPINGGNSNIVMQDDPTRIGSDASIRFASMPTESDWRLLDSVDHGQNEVRYLLESSDVSLRALAKEIDAMVDRPGT